MQGRNFKLDSSSSLERLCFQPWWHSHSNKKVLFLEGLHVPFPHSTSLQTSSEPISHENKTSCQSNLELKGKLKRPFYYEGFGSTRNVYQNTLLLPPYLSHHGLRTESSSVEIVGSCREFILLRITIYTLHSHHWWGIITKGSYWMELFIARSAIHVKISFLYVILEFDIYEGKEIIRDYAAATSSSLRFWNWWSNLNVSF